MKTLRVRLFLMFLALATVVFLAIACGPAVG